MGRETLQLSDAISQYLQDHSLRESDVLRRLRDETATLKEARMQLSPEQGQLLTFLVELTCASKAIEVGTFTGYSALCVASALPIDGKLVACDVSEQWTAIGRRYWQEAGVENKIDLRIAPAIETLKDLVVSGETGSFDFALIDADKENYGLYYKQIFELLRIGGLMLIDNVLWGGKVADPAISDPSTVAIRAFNREVYQDNRVSLSMLPIGDGMTLVRKRVL
jgi:predicted O-methyltransferase YrrM